MSAFDPEKYEERIAHLGRRREITAAWAVFAGIAVLLAGLGFILNETMGTPCHPRLKRPQASGIVSEHRGDWSERVDHLDWDEEGDMTGRAEQRTEPGQQSSDQNYSDLGGC
jgi:hypothetical protein